MRALGLTLAALLGLSPGLEAPTEGAAAGMRVAASAFLDGLSADQRERASFPLDGAVRTDWHFIPRERPGLSLGEMDAAQRRRAQALLRTGLSAGGLETVATVISLEQVLFAMGDNPDTRNPEWYFFSVFGEPGSEPWGWRLEGHHISLNFTVVEGAPVAWAPSFFGANPAEVRSGPRVGLRALSREEDLGRALARSLDGELWRAALVSDEAPREMLTEARPQVESLEPPGVVAADLSPAQREQLVELLEVYLGRMEPRLADARRSAIEAEGIDRVSFAWAGSRERGVPHYYRIQGPSFLVEYDNVQNAANHVHTVWRDFDGDFGRDLLAEHYASAHAHGDHGHTPDEAGSGGALALVAGSATAQEPRPVDGATFEEWFSELSNRGRWGEADELGTLNLIDAEVRRAAAGLVVEGRTVSLSHPIVTAEAPGGAPAYRFDMLAGVGDEGPWAMEELGLAYHGYALTHIDAVCHMSRDGRLYNGHPTDGITGEGCARLAITVAREGILTRGLLVDVPRLREVDWLEPGTAIYAEDLDAWERETGITARAGDALLIRTGHRARAAAGLPTEDGPRLAGLHVSAVRWLKERDVALLGSDAASDVLPSGVEGETHPVHRLVLVAMGMPILDNLDLRAVAEEAARLGRWEFMLTVAPLVIPGGTGSPANPIATF